MLVCLLFTAAWSAPCCLLLRAFLLSAGRGTLEAVSVPPGVQAHLTPRAARLMRQSRISAW